ncbi:hypothetical protein [Acaryochloris marina]|uniref:Uncharacterized protein n=1 Tax=Acaryochloris marina (strain MBIC 11017) TaxID=329726 RepID=B0C0K4_ACAM1|nr:hypothetical protein [Acaryochloris marina]ABW30797.1 hypothetical protein AM1_5856 [Acaryochloris marina MBIC11017]BDM79552.1 hypothetical protein AM10699_24200 [Acaryochloris marina MBIC10699]
MAKLYHPGELPKVVPKWYQTDLTGRYTLTNYPINPKPLLSALQLIWVKESKTETLAVNGN